MLRRPMRPFHWHRPALALALLCACPPPPSGTDGGPDSGLAQAPDVTSVSPARGPKSGGTAVTVNGANFEEGAKVYFGAGEASQVSLLSRRKLALRTPISSSLGPVDVRVVNPDGQSATLAGGFTYEPDVVLAIEESVTLNELDASDSSGANPVAVTVLAEVSVPSVTKGQGQGGGIRAEVGVATALSSPIAASDFSWSEAAYLGDADGPQLGDLARDRYAGQLSLAGATGAEVKLYLLAARFSVDEGASWAMADRDGSSNGVSADKLPRLSVSRPEVDWCKLGGQLVDPAPRVWLKVGQAGVNIYSQVYKLGVTDKQGAGAGIVGQIGYGAAGSEPAGWTWIDATYNVDTAGGANDEHQAALPNPGVGVYEFAFRYSLNGGPMRYCDADGSDAPGFTHDQAGLLTVTPVGIDACNLQFPSTLEARVGVKSGVVYGRVWSQTVTDQVGAGAGITAELGFGPENVAPTDSSWQWVSASYNVDADNGRADEYQATLNGPAAGSYHYAYRFKQGAGQLVHCDLDGSQNGYSSAQAGTMTSKPIDVDLCRLQGPASATSLSNGTSASFSGRVVAVGVTDSAGQGTGITAEVGYGPVGSTPGPGWTWVSAAYDSDQDLGASDEYRQGVAVPAAGNYEVAYRFRHGTGAFVPCDLDGSGNGYSAQQAGKLEVLPLGCRLQSVDKSSVASGGTAAALAAVKVVGVTDQAGQGAMVRGQVGVGTLGDDASQSAAWGWQEAAYSADLPSGGDEYRAELRPAYTGTRAVSFRFSVDNGVSWTYCDLNGNEVSGYEVSQQHALAVTDHTELDWCVVQWPPSIPSAGPLFSADGGSETVYGRVYEAGVTDGAGADPSIKAELGHGPKIEDPGLSSNWKWVGASFNVQYGNDDEYQANFAGVPAGTYAYAYRFNRADGGYCYADLDGSGANGAGQSWGGFSGETGSGAENVGRAVVTP